MTQATDDPKYEPTCPPTMYNESSIFFASANLDTGNSLANATWLRHMVLGLRLSRRQPIGPILRIHLRMHRFGRVLPRREAFLGGPAFLRRPACSSEGN
eukprot:4335289-Amphidinium_carterae.1